MIYLRYSLHMPAPTVFYKNLGRPIMGIVNCSIYINFPETGIVATRNIKMCHSVASQKLRACTEFKDLRIFLIRSKSMAVISAADMTEAATLI